ncbi:MAG TPA: hydroxyacylglutathione hydrolase [Polyangia bacterium]
MGCAPPEVSRACAGPVPAAWLSMSVARGRHVMGTLIIEPIACLKDNDAYLIRDSEAREGYLVDPSAAAPCVAALERAGVELRGILATHHHNDHVGGIAALVDDTGEPPIFVAAHAGDRGRIPRQSVFVDAPTDAFVATDVTVAGRRLVARHIPGHTRWAIAWGLVDGGDSLLPTDVFTGDTLFGAGCGRLFEGTPAEMFRSLAALTALPEATRLWFGHEYTASNLRFAAAVDPDNPAVKARAARAGAMTTPTTVGDEQATNPFVRAPTVEVFAARRAQKDKF